MGRKLSLVLFFTGLFLGLAACGNGSGDPVAATRQAISFVLTYQAENPRLTETPWTGIGTLIAILTGQPEVLVETATPTPSVTPRPVGTPAPAETVLLPAGAAPTLDGALAPGEWDGASQVSLVVPPDRSIPVMIQRADGVIYIAFSNLDQDETVLFPEVYVDAANNRADAWDDDDWWFHLSTQQCQGHGLAAIWSECGGAQAWQATTFVDSGATVEMAIPYDTLSLPAGDQTSVGIAFAAMWVTADGGVQRSFWPARASISQPATWGLGNVVGGW